MRPVARITRAALLRLGAEMDAQGLDAVDVHRMDSDSRWIVALRADGSHAAMISRAGRTPDEEAAEEAAERKKRLAKKRKVRK